MLIFAFFGAIAGYLLHGYRSSDKPHEREFALFFSVGIAIVLIGVSWSMARSEEENRLGLIEYVREEAYEEGYAEGYQIGWEEAAEEVIHRADRWAEKNLDDETASDLILYIQ